MQTFDLQTAIHDACAELGLDPANTNIFHLECRRRGLDPQRTRAYDLDKEASEMWAAFRKLKRAS